MFLRNPRSETNTEDLVSKFFEDFDPEVDLVSFAYFMDLTKAKFAVLGSRNNENNRDIYG